MQIISGQREWGLIGECERNVLARQCFKQRGQLRPLLFLQRRSNRLRPVARIPGGPGLRRLRLPAGRLPFSPVVWKRCNGHGVSILDVAENRSRVEMATAFFFEMEGQLREEGVGVNRGGR